MFQEIYVIDKDEKLTEELKDLFIKQENLKFKRILTQDLNLIFRNFPQLIIINEDNLKEDCIELYK